MIPVIIKSLKYFYKTKSVWWYTSSAKTRARYIKTALGSLWLGISNIIFISVLGVVYGIAFQAENFKDYFIPKINLLQRIAEPTRFYHQES